MCCAARRGVVLVQNERKVHYVVRRNKKPVNYQYKLLNGIPIPVHHHLPPLRLLVR